MCRIQGRLFAKLDASCSEEMAYFHCETIDFYFEECGSEATFSLVIGLCGNLAQLRS